jgi:hypothetical protein
MLNKKVLLGSLVAGAFLLPLAANAGIVSGQCYNCHTMHQTDRNGNTPASRISNGQLLIGNGCAGCHAAVGATNDDTGKFAFATYSAPQVHDSTQPNLAGFFSPTGSEVQHNMGFASNPAIPGYSAESVNGGTAPGGTLALTACTSCHGVSGGHHGAGASYRLLFPLTGTDQSADPDYGNMPGAAVNVPDTSGTIYDSEAMNGVCSGCHPDFHGSANQGLMDRTNALTANNTAWIRHPTDISLSDMQSFPMSAYNYTTNYNNSGDTNILPLGLTDTVVTADTIMCITCHYSHGGPYNDLLRFAYNNGTTGDNVADDNVSSVGCESCHDYTGTPQQGM